VTTAEWLEKSNTLEAEADERMRKAGTQPLMRDYYLASAADWYRLALQAARHAAASKR
jgi:hypothetical protein